MKTITTITFSLLILGMLVGCGSSSSTGTWPSTSNAVKTSKGTNTSIAPVAGTYVGSVSDTKLGQLTMSLTLLASGSFSGTIPSTGTTTHPISGTIDSSGNTTLAVNDPPATGGGVTESLTGVLSLNSSTGKLTGTLTGTWHQAVAPPNGSGSDTMVFTLAKQ